VLEARGTLEAKGQEEIIMEDRLVHLRDLAATTGAPTWIPGLIHEIEELQARVERLERENAQLTEQLAFYRRRVAA
jgi:cell shape-determining protein MreC